MSGRTPAQRALDLADAIYAAAVDPPAWSAFLEALSAELGDASIAMSVMLPGWNLPPEYYRVRLSEKYVPAFEKHFRKGLPWPMTHPLFQAGFARGRDIFPDEQVAETDYYRDYMQPQGMAPEGPLAHLMIVGENRPISGISIQRMVGGREFTDEDVEMCNLLVPHLANAATIRFERIRAEQEHDARTHILDRMRVGIVVIDLAQRAVVTNRSARLILDEDDGLYERGGVIHASSQHEERQLQRLIREAVHYDAEAAAQDPAAGGPSDGSNSFFEGGFMAVSRPSGKASYALVVSPVFASPKGSVVGDEVAAIYVADPAPGQIPHAETFRHLFDLTRAEAEVVGLLAAGHALEAISEQRGVKIGTTRTLLKRVYAKTRASRQGELIRLVLAGDAVSDTDPEGPGGGEDED